jgi:hypothetical protein
METEGAEADDEEDDHEIQLDELWVALYHRWPGYEEFDESIFEEYLEGGKGPDGINYVKWEESRLLETPTLTPTAVLQRKISSLFRLCKLLFIEELNRHSRLRVQ